MQRHKKRREISCFPALLSKHPQVEKVNYFSLPDYSLYEKYSPNGSASIFTDVKSPVTHPIITTHSELSPAELLDQGIKLNTMKHAVENERFTLFYTKAAK